MLSGRSGTGKSITAFHAARRVHRAGWVVVELSGAGLTSAAAAQTVQAFAAMRGPVLAVVDDAQALAPGVAAGLENAVNRDHAVLLVSTDSLECYHDVTVEQLRAQAVIMQYCLDHLEEIEPEIARSKVLVGPDEPYRPTVDRLRAAQSGAVDPWSLMFAISDGERRLPGSLDRLAAPVVPALLLGAVAVCQLTLLGAGVAHDQVARELSRLTPDAFGPSNGGDHDGRLCEAVQLVQAEHLIQDSDGRLRIPHLRLASRVLMDLADRDDQVGAGIRAMIRVHLRNPDLPVRGKTWVLGAVNRTGGAPRHGRGRWLDERTVRALLEQALAASSGVDRNAAAGLLCELAFAGTLTRRHWQRITPALQCWLCDLEATEVQSIGQLVMYARADHPDLYDATRRAVPPHVLATRFSVGATGPTASGWGEVIHGLAPDRGADDYPAWVTAFTDNVDRDALRAGLTVHSPDTHRGHVASLIDDLAGLAPTLASDVLRICGPQLRSGLENDLAAAGEGLSDWAFGHMGRVARLAGQRAQSVRGGQAGSALRRNNDRSGRKGSLDAICQQVREFGYSSEHCQPPQDVSGLADTVLSDTVLQVMSQVDWVAAGSSLEGRSDDEWRTLDSFLVWLDWLCPDLVDALPKPHAG